MSAVNADKLITPLASLLAQAMRVAGAYKQASERVKPADPALIEKAAAALVDNRWVAADQKAAALSVLADHTQALKALAELSAKSAEDIAHLHEKLALATGTDPRVRSGAAVGHEKPASAPVNYIGGRPETDADREFAARMQANRMQLDAHY